MRVFVTDADRKQIKANAQATGLTVSSYLQTVGLNRLLSSKADTQAIDTMLQVNADLGRLGGLLKLWLSTQSGAGAPAYSVRQVLNEIRATQQQMLVAISSVRRR